MWASFPLLKAFSVGVRLSKEFRRGELDGREPLPLPLGSRFFGDRASFHTCLLESVDLLLSIARYLHSFMSFALSRTLGCSSARSELSKLYCRNRQMLLTKLSVPSIGPPYFSLWRSLATHHFEQNIECTETAMYLAARTVEVDDNITHPEIIVGLLLHRDYGSSHR